VLSSFGEALGLDRELALRVAGAFGGGMARMGETCGAVTGALMVIGLKYGMTQAKDEAAREQTYKLAQELAARFKERHRSIICRELLGYDLSSPEGRKAAYDKGLFSTLCPELVRDAVEILEQML
jgi:C_GCAxxG_C_C family probable redox protein